MSDWKLSIYTSVVKCDSGGFILHNSFMGAIALIPSEKSEKILDAFSRNLTESDLNDPDLKELCEGGFFVPSELDERKITDSILDQERDDTCFSMIVLPHEDCNFRCIYCYEKFNHGKMDAKVINGLKAFIYRKAGEYNEIRVSWFGGEPLLALDVICELSDSFIASCKEKAAYYASSMSTNGYLLTPANVDALLMHQIRGFQVTLDGPESIHNEKRKLKNGSGTYTRIFNNLANMQQRKDEFSVKIRVNFDNQSIPFIDKWIADELVPLFANDSRFVLNFHPVGKWGGPNDHILNVCEPDSICKIKYGLTIKSQKFGFSNRLLKEYLAPHGHVCYASKKSSIVVGSDGTIYKCSKEFDEPQNRIGELLNDGRLIVDQNKWNQWTTLDDKDITACNSCSFYPCCQGRKCPLAAMKERKPLCPMRINDYEQLVKSVACIK